MFAKSDLVFYIPLLQVLYGLHGAIMFIFGLNVIANVPLVTAFGPVAYEAAVTFVILGVLRVCAIICGLAGSRQHNKFYLLAFACSSVTLLSVQTMVCSSLHSYVMTLPFTPLEIIKCLQYGVDLSERPECISYLQSRSIGRLFYMWEGLHKTALLVEGGEDAKAMIMEIQSGVELGGYLLPPCCGFGPPGNCGFFPNSANVSASNGKVSLLSLRNL